MSNFPKKQFNGVLYTFEHLAPLAMQVPHNALQTSFIPMQVTFGCHCFTEQFDQARHMQSHRYFYKNELRAFDVLRYTCSLQLSRIMQSMLQGMIYQAQDSYTYTAHITLVSVHGPQSYSVFFSLEKDKNSVMPALRMFVKSAYLKPLVAKQHAQSWRFASLAGKISGIFPAPEKKPRPKKKKAP